MEKLIKKFLYTYKSSSGYGCGSTDGTGNGDGSGHGHGEIFGSGYKEGCGVGSGKGNGYGEGGGSGHGCGTGDGVGNGSGIGQSGGSGRLRLYDKEYKLDNSYHYNGCYSSMSEIQFKKYKGNNVYYIDGIPCIFKYIDKSITFAEVYVINYFDLSLSKQFVYKFNNCFAHGYSVKEAKADAENKYYSQLRCI